MLLNTDAFRRFVIGGSVATGVLVSIKSVTALIMCSDHRRGWTKDVNERMRTGRGNAFERKKQRGCEKQRKRDDLSSALVLLFSLSVSAHTQYVVMRNM